MFLLPPIAGIDTYSAARLYTLRPIAPIAGIDTSLGVGFIKRITIAPHCGD